MIPKLLISFYGDDFTGSTDAMEALQWAGLRTVLFLAPPTREQLVKFHDLRAFGIAGASRTMSPQEMDTELVRAFTVLRDSGASIAHYKMCSTFDSSPEIGSIGKALEIGRRVLGTTCVPILVGAPSLGRHQVFGNLFARSGLDTEPFRLDRHPTMQHHPITPMNEADIRVHLARQTALGVALFDVLRLEDSNPDAVLNEWLERPPDALLFDVLTESHLATVGRLIETMSRHHSPLFTVGSSGIEYALTKHWRESGRMRSLRSHEPGRPMFGPTDQLVVISGSCSPVTDKQTTWALEHGFSGVALDPARLIRPESSEAEIERCVLLAIEKLDRGQNVILHSSRGPMDPRVRETDDQFAALGFSPQDIKLKNGRTLGPKLGRILRGILERKQISRAAVAGGDTSGYVARELGIEALEAIAPSAPGCPLCRIQSSNPLHGREILFKGGQVGRIDIWGMMLEGAA